MSWMFVHLPRFALDVRSRALIREQPLALIEQGRSEILLVSDLAEASGIRPGMSISSAYCLHPYLQLIHRNPQIEQDSLLDLAQLLYAYAAHISIKPPQGLLLEIGSMLSLFGGLDPLWRQVQDCLEQQGFQVWLAAAHTPLAARLLAEAGGIRPTLDQDALQRRLRSIPITQAGLPEQTAERLSRMGLKQFGQLLDLPAVEVGRRFGAELLHRLERLQGHLADPQQFFSPPETFVRRLEFFEEVESISGLLFPLQRLLRELQNFLQSRQRVTQCLRIGFGHRNQPDTRTEIRSVQPEYRADEWLQLCRLRLERAQLYAGVLSLNLQVEELLPLQVESDDLFRQHQAHHLSRQQLLSRLQARLGTQQILNVQTLADHRPERSAGWISPDQAAKGRGGSQSSNLLATCTRPLWLLPDPQPAASSQLQLVRGPERIQAGWWDSETPHQIGRDYFIARTESGSLCWVFRNPQGRWFIHGWFG